MSRLRGIKAISFDMDGTLWDFDAAMRRALGKTLLELQRVEPEAAATLDALKHRYTLGLVSNGNSYPEHFGLEGLVGFAVYAQDHGGVQKPDPALFHIALGEAGCSARELVHVGDSLEIDVAGARNAGIRSVWLNRNGYGASPDIKPDAEIASLRELGQIL